MPTGSSTVAPAGSTACLRLAARIASSLIEPQRRRKRCRIAQMRSSSASSSTISRPQNAPDHLGGEVVGRRTQATGGDDQVDAECGLRLERRPHVGGPVADDRDLGQIDPSLTQPLGQPGPVAVGDDARQDLGTGDDDGRAGAHGAQVGRLPAGSSRGARPGRTS